MSNWQLTGIVLGFLARAVRANLEWEMFFYALVSLRPKDLLILKSIFQNSADLVDFVMHVVACEQALIRAMSVEWCKSLPPLPKLSPRLPSRGREPGTD